MNVSARSNGRWRVLTHSGAHKAGWEVAYSSFAREDAEAEYDRLSAKCEHGGVRLIDYRNSEVRHLWNPTEKKVEHE